MTQWATQGADAFGNCNEIDQCNKANAKCNDLSMSDLTQQSCFNVCATGDKNCVDQNLCQDANNNCLTKSSLSQFTAKIADVYGCDNKVKQCENF